MGSQCVQVSTYQQQTGWGSGEPPTPRSDHGPGERSALQFFSTCPTHGCSCPRSWTGWVPAVGGRRRRTHCCSGRGRCPAPKPWILKGHSHIDLKSNLFLEFLKCKARSLLFQKTRNAAYQRVQTLTIHSPDLDLPVISSRHNKRHARVEGSPVDPAVMTLHTEGRAKDTKYLLVVGLACGSWPQSFCMLNFLFISNTCSSFEDHVF